jgi:Tol biopolymer transport system component/putative cell wall-binding protein
MFRHRINRAKAEQLISGRLAPDDAPPGYAGLAAMTENLQGPAMPAELPSETSVVAAIVAAIGLSGAAEPGHAREDTAPRQVRRKAVRRKRVGLIALITSLGIIGTAVGTEPWASSAGPAYQIAFVRQRFDSNSPPPTDPSTGSKDECTDSSNPSIVRPCDIFAVPSDRSISPKQMSAVGGRPVFVASSPPKSAASATSISVDKPPGVTGYDVLVAQITVTQQSPTATVVSAPNSCSFDIGCWHFIRSDPSGAAGSDVVSWLFYYIVAESEPATSYAFTQTIASPMQGTILAYSGVLTSKPLDTSSGQGYAGVTDITAPAVTTARDNEMVIGLFAHVAAAAIETAPSGMATRSDGDPATANTFKTADVVQPLAGSTGNKVAHSTTSSNSVGQLVALIPSTFHDWPVWSPDGTKLAYMGAKHEGNDDGELWVVNADGTNPRKLTNLSSGPSYSWAPDSNHIAYHANNTPIGGASYTDEPSDIWSVNVNLPITAPNVVNPNPKNLTSGDAGEKAFPQWSHDGSKIAYMTQGGGHSDQVWVMDANGSNRHNISTGPNATIPNALALPGLLVGGQSNVWAPDDSKVVFVVSATGTGSGGGVYTAAPTSIGPPADPVRIFPTGAGPSTADVAFPTWSPNGKFIAFRGNDAAANPGDIAELWIISADGSDSALVTNEGSIWMRWSHDSRHLAFRGKKHTITTSASSTTIVQTVDAGNADVKIVDVPATGPLGAPTIHDVTSHGSGNFSWSPNNAMLAVEGQPGGDIARAKILLFTLTFGPFSVTETALTDGLQDDLRPAFGPPVAAPGGGPGGGPCAKTDPRLGGPDRIDTANLVSQDSFPGNGSAAAVVLARFDLFPDALAATPLAVAKHGPLLLTPSDHLDSRTKAETQRVLPSGGTVYLIGQTIALSGAVANELTAAGYNVQRLGGPTRFETATTVADQGLGNPSTLFIATGLDFADALAGGAAAPPATAAVVLSYGSTHHPSTDAYLAAHPSDTLYALGGPAATAYPAASGIVGADRYETSTKVASKFFVAPTAAGIARGDVFADALSGGAHISPKNGPMLVVQSHALPPVVANYLQANKATICTAYIYGGPVAVDEPTRAAVLTAIS